jgi:hypothetical protein
MVTRHILRKQLSSLPCRFILGVIGQSKELSAEINLDFLHATENDFEVEDLLPAQDFIYSPESYFKEMGNQLLSTIIITLKNGGSYTDLHNMKKKAERLEERFMNSEGSRTFNINPGAVGTYGLCLASHKPTGGRQDINTFAYGFHPHLLFGGSTYYERIMRWRNNKLELIGRADGEGKFLEYTELSRIAKFEGLVRSLPGSKTSVELMSD